ncbi:MAG: stage II sporulation protein M, partial [Ignavibacteriales bacterium]|nr:stage II sporulation protein M [Ignavibacteriales bacterium]
MEAVKDGMVQEQKQGLIEWGVSVVPMKGQAESGDRHLVKCLPRGCLVAVIDGLGHGDEAANAAKAAVAILETFAHESLISLIRRCNEQLRSYRGVVMSLAFFDANDETMAWLGVGNVEG